MKQLAIISLAAMMAFSSCKSDLSQKWEEEIMDADRAFSNRCIKDGIHESFLNYAASDVVLLKPNMLPIVGHSMLEEHYKGKADTTFVLKWEPRYAKVSKSGDLGYSYGIWEAYIKSNPTEISKGTYLTVWERQADGQWKFIADTGNDGIGE
jgi:ketosteroid isomerase-like protein